jgi:hypothetical protein
LHANFSYSATIPFKDKYHTNAVFINLPVFDTSIRKGSTRAVPPHLEEALRRRGPHYNRTSRCDGLLRSCHNWIRRHVTPRFLEIKQYALGSIVGIATGYGLHDQWVAVRALVGSRIFHVFMLSRPALGSLTPSIQWVPGALSPG